MTIFKILSKNTSQIKKSSELQSKINSEGVQLLQQTQNALNSSIAQLEKFTNQEIPQLADKQQEIIASLEKLAQNAQIQIKKK